MIFVTLILFGLLASGLFLAARELVGFEPSPEWRNVAKLRERLSYPLPSLDDEDGGSMTRHCMNLRHEFTQAWRLCRFLAPITGDAGYVGTLITTKARFHATFALALVCGATGCVGACAKCADALRRMSESMRSSALLILTSNDLEAGFTPA